MANTDIVATPPPGSVNTGLASPRQSFMLDLFGVPGTPKSTCGKVTNAKLKPHIFTKTVGPIKVTGLDVALDSLKTILEEVESLRPDLLKGLKTAGMLCVRKQRKSDVLWSNHSWGTAIDLFYGTGVLPQGKPKTHQGLLDLYFFFHKHGWYWGGGFSGKSVDGMHFEMSRELLEDLFD